ncbi:MAG: hypothetical protein N2201_06530 [candidate division WOR-3 bacterium]|nr:hypothetical protein [candidate division WOR-3 bacterium]
MNNKNHSRIFFVVSFISLIINLALLAIIVAMSIALNQHKRLGVEFKVKVEQLENKVADLTPTYTAKQMTILKTLVNNPEIAKLIRTKPSLGGNWGCWSEKNVKFLTEDKLLILYDDGHMMGAMVVRVKNPEDIKTWRVLWNTLL